MASHYKIIPLKNFGNPIEIAICDPFKQEIELILDNSHNVEFVLATSESVKKAIRKAYGV